MPIVSNQPLYKAIYGAASWRLSTASYESYLRMMPKGSALYRYTGYRNSMPQADPAGRTIWSSLSSDANNRWTGIGSEDSKGSQGLYTSSEFYQQDKPFPELEHYLDPNENPVSVSYYEYAPNRAPKLVTANETSLRSMFLFTAKDEFRFLDLSLSAPGGNSLLADIFKRARQESPDVIPESATLESLYFHPDDASFNRAIGNAVFESTGITAFQTTSVRDRMSGNVIFKGSQGGAVTILKPEGRASFFFDQKTGKAKGVVTIADLQYNAIFEDSGLGKIPSKETQTEQLAQIASGMADKLAETFQREVENHPPTPSTEEIGKQIESIQGQLSQSQTAEALSQMTGLSTQLQSLSGQGLQAYEASAVRNVTRALESLSAITDAVRIGQEEGSSGRGEPPKEAEPVTDPPEDLLPKDLD